jgi:hypothetical protein
MGFAVDNLESAMVALKEKGVKFSPHTVNDGLMRLAFFGDPE